MVVRRCKMIWRACGFSSMFFVSDLGVTGNYVCGTHYNRAIEMQYVFQLVED